MKNSHRRNGQLVVSYQVVTDPCCGLSIIFCGFMSHLIGHDTINILEISSDVHGFMGKTLMCDVIQSVGFNSRYCLDDVVPLPVMRICTIVNFRSIW